MPCSQTPVARATPSLEDVFDLRGVAVPDGFRLRLFAAAGASIRTSYSLFSLPRGAPVLSPLNRTARTTDHGIYFGAQFHGLSNRCLRFAVQSRPRTTQDSLSAGGQSFADGVSPRSGSS